MATRPAALLPLMTKVLSSDRDRATKTDRDLLRRFAQDKDQAAFAALVKRHGQMVLGACRRVLGNPADAEDACQAVFLILARKSNSARWQPSIASWLYATAQQVALNARTARSRRMKHEGRAAQKLPDNPLDKITGAELLEILDEELRKLPERYRGPVVLCCLEGMTRDEAARQLGVPSATLKGQLERGRRRLHDALARRGVALGAGFLVLLATSPAGASPPRLIQAVLAAISRTPSKAVATLAEGVAVNGLANKSVLMTLALIGAVALVVGVGSKSFTAAGQPAEVQTPAKSPDPDKGTELAVPAKKATTASGRVLTPDGKPVAKATVYWHGWKHNGSPMKPEAVATTGPDGTFTFDPSRRTRGVTAATMLIATADGWAADWRQWKHSADGTTLRLVPDEPIKGRLLDLEGKPVANAMVRVQSIAHAPAGDWAGVANAFRLNPEWLSLERYITPEAPIFAPEVKTDANGRFELKGIGADRVASLRFQAPGIESAHVYVITAPKFDLSSVLPKSGEREGGFDPKFRRMVYGPTFEHAARPSHDIIGRVTDAATGKPVAGVRLFGTANAPNAGGEPQWHDPAETTTDIDGRYRLTGLPKAVRRFIHVQCGDAPYLDRLIEVNDVEALKTATADIKLDRCLSVEGVLTDRVTGKPVVGHAIYLPRPEPDDARSKADTRLYRQSSLSLHPTGTWANTDEAGRFKLRVPHGPGLIVARADTDRDPNARYIAIRVAEEDRKYLRPHDLDAIDTLTMKGAEPEEVFNTGVLAWPLRWENGYAIFDAKPAEQILKVAIAFDPGRSVSGTLVGPDGKPVAGALAMGTQATNEMNPTSVPTDQFTAAAMTADRPRQMFFVHETKGLVGTAMVKSTDKAPVIHLQPWGIVTGRAVLPDGKPAANAEVSIQFTNHFTDEMIRQKLYRDLGHVAVRTDATGRFRLEGQFPGLEVGIHARLPGLRLGGSIPPITPKAGEELDVGDIKVPTKRE
jgi:RNA polymerase sigma factor (sigma-70 family)